MKPYCPTHEHVSRRALMKGTLATAAGTAVMNWGNLTDAAPLAEAVKQKKKHCILLWMNGGISQFETFDMKVGKSTGGLFRPIPTNVAGTQICELMPKMAQQMDKIAVIRSMHTSEIDHPGGIYLMHTGYRPSPNVRFPEVGAIVAKYQGTEKSDLPNFIKVSTQGDAGAGFLGPSYQPFSMGSRSELPQFATNRLDKEIEARRNELRSFVEDEFTRGRPNEPAKMHREAYEAARRLNGATAAFKIDAEWEKYRDLYGDSLLGRRCLLARQLVEAGVPFVELGQSSYDSHADNFESHKGRVPPMEHAWAGLITDLDQRGLLDDTLIVWTGEIGRTPRINNRAGRDHYVRNWSTALAGCGIKGGTIYGSTNDDGTDIKSDPVTEGDFFATIYHALGIDPKIENMAGSRPVPLAPFGSNVVETLLG